MIYLITGAPGTGKTAHALGLFHSLPQYPDRAIVIGVRDYKGKATYYETLPDGFDFEGYPGYVFLIDEVQDYFPSRVAGRPVPAALEFLPKHRHIGQDYILTCQFANQIDVKLRHIVGRHIHLEKEPVGVFMYEAGRCVENVKDFPPTSKRPRGSISAEVKASYVSMEGEETVLQKSKPRLPLKLWLILGVVVSMFSVAAYFLFTKPSLLNPVDQQTASEVMGQGYGVSTKGASVIPEGKPAKSEVKPLRDIRHPAELSPGNSDFPELAAQPRIPVSCVSSSRGCKCFDQAAQLIEGMAATRCRALIEGRDSMVAAWGRDDTPKRPLYPVPPLSRTDLVPAKQIEQKSVEGADPNAVSVGEAPKGDRVRVGM
jgi:hypothetical protein